MIPTISQFRRWSYPSKFAFVSFFIGLAVILGGVNVDAIGLLKDSKVLIEISVFHRLMPDKQERLIKTALPSFQINLEQFRTKQASRELLERALFEDESIRKWIYHPKLRNALEKAQTRLDLRLKESKAQWEKNEELRKNQVTQIRQNHVAIGRYFGHPPFMTGGCEPRRVLMLSSALPSPERIALSAKRLAEKTGAREEDILLVASTYTSRSQLRGHTSEDLVDKWNAQLNLAKEDVEYFLVDAGYLVRC